MIILTQIIFLILFIYFFFFILRIFLGMMKFYHNSFTIFLCKITDPILYFFKKRFRIRIGNVDFSPFIPIFIIYLILKFLSDVNLNYNLNINYLWYFLFFAIDTILVLFSISIIILLILLIISSFFYYNNYFISSVRNIFYPILTFLRAKIVRFKSETSYYFILIITIILIFIITHSCLKNLYQFFELKCIKIIK